MFECKEIMSDLGFYLRYPKHFPIQILSIGKRKNMVLERKKSFFSIFVSISLITSRHKLHRFLNSLSIKISLYRITKF